MFNEATGVWKYVLPALFFPMFFQDAFVAFTWGASDPWYLMTLKRIFLLLPSLAIILACWASIACLLTVIIRQERREFVIALFVTWWDLAKAIFAFWGGTFKFLLTLIGVIIGLVKVVVVGLWIMVHDIVLIPFRVVRILGENLLSPGLPWISITLTLIWCIGEAGLFSYVTAPLVVDTLANLTGDELTENFVQIPLFFFMLFLVLSSFAVLATWTKALKTKDVAQVIKLSAIEFLAMGLEVVFLYREFVESLMPWFAQHTSRDFSLGIVGTLSIAGFAWLAMRGMSWIAFASHGIPTIMAIIQGTGVKKKTTTTAVSQGADVFAFTMGVVARIKMEIDWVRDKGDEVLSAFVLPPLQVVAASVNFCTLLVTTQHLFDLPLKSIKTVMDSRQMLKNIQLKPPQNKK